MEDLFRLDGKVALVMGGAGGIGRRLAYGLSLYGARVVVSGRSREALLAAAGEIRARTRGETAAMPADVTDESSVERLVQEVVETMGGLDILVNAQGVNIKRDAFEFPVEDWDQLFAVNVKGTMIACKQAGRVFKERGGGKIVNLSSVRGIRGHRGGNAGYCATKGAVELITRTLALEWAPYRIHVNALGPALIITPGTVHIRNNPKLAEEYRAMIPLGRLGEPDDLIGACVFLASRASDFVTGQTIYVDGGLTAG